jgi:hypothetical protein
MLPPSPRSLPQKSDSLANLFMPRTVWIKLIISELYFTQGAAPFQWWGDEIEIDNGGNK